MSRKSTTPQPTTEWVKIADLRIDPTVNTRPPNQAKVAKIADEFDPSALGIPEISERRDGTKIILDGQHRVEGAKAQGWNNGQMIECRVHRGLTHAQECRMFRMLNDETPVAPIYKLLAGIGEGHEPEATIGAVVDSVGLKIVGAAQDGGICSAKALRFVYGGARFLKGDNVENPELLQATLRTILEAWGKSKDGLRGDIIEGVGSFLARYGKEVDHAVLVTRLAQHSPLNIIADARSLRSVHGWQMNGAIAARIVILYNSGKRSKKLADWWTR